MIVLDTHAWVFWAGGSRQLSRAAAALIRGAIDDGSLHVSSISAWDVALLVKRGRLELTMEVGD